MTLYNVLLHLSLIAFTIACICVSLAAMAYVINQLERKYRIDRQAKAFKEVTDNMKELFDNLEVEVCNQSENDERRVHVDQNIKMN